MYPLSFKDIIFSLFNINIHKSLPLSFEPVFDITIKMKYVHPLTHVSQMDFPISIDRISLFQILGVLSGIFHFYSISNVQTVETLIR